jgi:acetyl esterase
MLVWLHGGGHVVGTLDSYDALCRMLCMDAECIVIAVDYRLAPEHKFPAGVEDSYAALKWSFTHAASLGGDRDRVALGGDSAGGNLAAVCAILARDGKIGDLVLQLLVYPRTAAAEDSESHHRYADGHLLTRRTILWFHDHYRASGDDRRDWRYAPLDCPDLSDLPPALVIVGECDPLHDEGVAYADALRRAGNAVTLSDYPGMIHPFFSMGGALDAGRAAHRESTRALRRAFGTEHA